MKKKIATPLIIITIALFTGYNIHSSQESKSILSFTLDNTESIAACETDPVHDKNKFYCSKTAGSSEGSCVETGSGSEPRCSGNT